MDRDRRADVVPGVTPATRLTTTLTPVDQREGRDGEVKKRQSLSRTDTYQSSQLLRTSGGKAEGDEGVGDDSFQFPLSLFFSVLPSHSHFTLQSL